MLPSVPINHASLTRPLVVIVLCIPMALFAADRDLVIDPVSAGPYAVGSTNFTIDEQALNTILNAGLDAGQFQEGMNDNGNLRYIDELLAFPQDSFNFRVEVPDDETLYGASAGSSLPFSAYVFYPTRDDNDRPGYQVFVGDDLPHMQDEGEAPIFADETALYPVAVFSHGDGGHPDGLIRNYMDIMASHGYVVVALYHGDRRFETTEGRRFNLRPLAVKHAIDHLLEHPDFSGHVDPERIGGLGTSFGGATMMALLGAQKVNPDVSSVITNNLLTTTVDPRIKAAGGVVPFMGMNPYTFFGRDSEGTTGIDRPFMAHSANMDEVAEYALVQESMENIPGTKYLVEYDMETHVMSEGAVSDAFTWLKVFMDVYVKGDDEQADVLRRLQSVSDSGVDSLVLVTEPAADAGDPGVSGEIELTGVISTRGASTAAFSAGARLAGSDTVRSEFTAGDEVSITATIRPQAEDLGKSANLYMVLRSDIDGVPTFTYRDIDGVFRPWNLRAVDLEPFDVRQALATSESVDIFSGTLAPGRHRIYLGYATSDAGAPLHFNSVAYKIDVGE